MSGLSFIVSVGKWGGFYLMLGYSWRICLGFIAFTIIPDDIDNVFDSLRKP